MPSIDLKFIEDLKNGEDKAWKQVRRLCYRKIYSYTQDHQITDDLVQDSIGKIIKALPDYSPKKGKSTVDANFKNWVGEIAYNTYLNYREKKQREVTFKELETALGLDKSDGLLIEEDTESLSDLLSLSMHYTFSPKTNPLLDSAIDEVFSVIRGMKDVRGRLAVILKFFYGMKINEIADILRENVDTINNVIYRGKDAIKKMFIEKGIDVGYLEPSDWDIKHIRKPLSSYRNQKKKENIENEN